MKKVNKKKGFTLAELLVVIAIIAILVAIAIPVFSGALDGAKKATDDANIRSAYAEYMVECLTNNPPTTPDKTAADAKTYVEDKTGTLQYYTELEIDAAGVWKGKPLS